jgi:hypothetical protein
VPTSTRAVVRKATGVPTSRSLWRKLFKF